MALESRLENKYTDAEKELFERIQHYKYELFRWTGNVTISMGVVTSMGLFTRNYNNENLILGIATGALILGGAAIRHLAYHVTKQNIESFYKKV